MIKRIIAGAAAVCLLLMMAACTLPAYSKDPLPNPKLTVTAFTDAMRERDLAAAQTYISNYSSMGIDGFGAVSGSDIYEKTVNMLFDSYSVDFYDRDMSDVPSDYTSGDMIVHGRDAEVSFLFTYLYLDSMSSELAAVITEIGEQRMYYGEVFDSEEAAMSLAEEAFGRTFSEDDMKQYYTTKRITLEAQYTDDGWKLDMSDEFYSALLGR